MTLLPERTAKETLVASIVALHGNGCKQASYCWILTYSVHVTVIVKESMLRFWRIYVFSIPEYEKVVSGMPTACFYVCKQEYVRHYGTWTVWRIFLYSAIKGLSTVGRCPMNRNILAQKYGALHRGSQTQNCDFLENRSNDFDWMSVFLENAPLNKIPRVLFLEN
jgi:hypothetical protein